MCLLIFGIARFGENGNFAELMESGESLGDVLEILGASVGYNNTEFSNLWSSATAGKAAISLFDGSAAAFNETLEQMANSTGTVEKNHKKMTDVSEYSSQRLEVASENLKIAVGEQLNPVLDLLREGAAGVLETATAFISENPILISVITGAATALGLLAAGVSALMIAKSAAAAIEALNISLTACPVGLIAVGVTGLVTALGTFIAQAEAASAEVELLTEASRTLSETVENGDISYDDAVVSAEAAAETVKRYIERLKELEAQGLCTDAQQTEYAMIVEKINSLVPGLNAEIDAQTHALVGGTDALWDQAEAWKENAIQQAVYTRYKDDIAAVADAEYELAKNKALLSIAESDQGPIEARIEKLKEEIALNQQAQDGIDRWAQRSYRAANALTAGGTDLYAALAAANAELEKNKTTQEDLKEAIDVGSQTIAEQQVQVDAATAAYNSLSTQVENTGEDVKKSTGDMADASNEAFASIREDLDKQFGLFEDLSEKSESSIGDLTKNLRNQQKAFNDYAKNLTIAMERGINEGVVQQLSDGSAESMQILAELVAGTDEEIWKFNEAFLGMNKAKDNMATALSGSGEIVWDAIEESTAAVEAANDRLVEAYNESYEASRESIDRQIGLFDDLSGKCDMSIKDMTKNLKSQKEAFDNYAENLTIAMERGIDEGVVRQLSDGSAEAMQILAELVEGSDKQIAEFNAAFLGAEAAKDNLATALTGMDQVVLDAAADAKAAAKKLGEDVVDGAAAGVRKAIPNYKCAVVDLANEGMWDFKRLNGINSPSKRYQEMAKYNVDGLVVQYKTDIPRYEKATTDLANAGNFAFARARQATFPSMVSVTSTPQAQDNSTLYTLLRQLLSAVREGKVIALDSKTFIGATASSYDQALGQNKILIDRGAQ